MTRPRTLFHPPTTMDLDIDLGSLLRPTARAAADGVEPVQRVIYPMVPSWQRDGDGAPPSAAADAAAAAAAAASQDQAPAPAAVGSDTAASPASMRSGEAWVPTHSARLGTWPAPAASNDMPGPAATRPGGVGVPPAAQGSEPVDVPVDVAVGETGTVAVDLPLAVPRDMPRDVPRDLPRDVPRNVQHQVAAAAPIASAPPPEGPAQRRAPARTVVGAHGQRWLQSLSVGLRPLLTARRHPHVIDRLAAAWPEPRAASACLDDLLFNRRPGRRGFSLAVLAELCELQRALAERRRR